MTGDNTDGDGSCGNTGIGPDRKSVGSRVENIELIGNHQEVLTIGRDFRGGHALPAAREEIVKWFKRWLVR